MSVVVCTVVHHPADARIFYREIQALLDAGHDVTSIAPHAEQSAPVRDEHQGHRVRARVSPGPPPATPLPGAPRGTLRTVTIPRASGRHRLGPLRAARAALAAQAA